MHKQLLTSEVSFEKCVENSSLQEEAFIALVRNRDQLLEQTFYKSFKPQNFGLASQLSLPEVLEDILYALFDGYKSTLLAFGKFQVRQRQQLDYKNERLRKINDDLRDELRGKRAYDAFLQNKVANIAAEMARIEQTIKVF